MTETDGQRNRPDASASGARRVSSAALTVLAVSAVLAFLGFIALGTWQLYRLQWKLDLIERVGQRVDAAPVPAPGPQRWPQVDAAGDEYRRVRIAGTLLHQRSALTQAVTGLGSGFWLLTPLRAADGGIVLVNRGFIAAADAARVRSEIAGAGETAADVTGLLRMTEPGGGFLRRNDPAGERWYSRDVQAIAAARGLSPVAPYFIDADRRSAGGAPGRPVGGLTVLAFHNNHLVYALTWYALALMVAGAAFWVVRDGRRSAASGIDDDARQD